MPKQAKFEVELVEIMVEVFLWSEIFFQVPNAPNLARLSHAVKLSLL